MGVLFSQLLRLNATAACVAVFVVALGSLWVYVALAKSSQSPAEYEGSLSDVATAGKAGGGGRKEKREGKRGRAKKVRCNGCLRWLLTLNASYVCVWILPLLCVKYLWFKCLCVCESEREYSGGTSLSL